MSPADVWAVGVRGYFSSRWRTLVEHWDGHRWRVVRAPSPGEVSLDAVDAASANDVWAVGTYYAADRAASKPRPLVLHWDGAAWRIVKTPPINAELIDVAAVSPKDVWAVGIGERSGGVALHWNGRRWSWTSHGELLLAVSGASANDVWAVGVTTDEYAEPFEPTLRRWTGRWSRVAGPTVRGNAELLDVAFADRARGWAVGTDDDTLILRWNGRRWIRVSSPRERRYYSAFGGVTALGDGRAWAAGSVCVDDPAHVPEEPWHGDWECESRPLAARWDGRQWRTTSMPPGLYGRLFDVDAASADAVWAVGYRGGGSPLVLRWQG